MRSNPQGMTINYSMVTNENGEQEIGFRYNDTDGINIDKHYTGKKEEDMLNKLCFDVLKDMEKQTAAIKEAKAKKALEAEKKKKATPKKAVDYDAIIEQLQKTIEDMREENQSLKLDNEVLNKRIKDSLKTQQKPVQKQEEKYDVYKMLENIFDDYIKEGWF